MLATGNDKIMNLEAVYTYREKVHITSGFYGGNYGKVIGLNKTGFYDVEIEIDNKKLIIICEDKHLRKVRGFGFPKW